MRDSTKLLGHVWLSSFFSGFNADFIELSYITNSLCLFQPPDFPLVRFFYFCSTRLCKSQCAIDGHKDVFRFPSRNSEAVLEIVICKWRVPIRSASYPGGLQDAKESEKKLLAGHTCNKGCSDWQAKWPYV